MLGMACGERMLQEGSPVKATIHAESRPVRTKGDLRRLRASGKIPGVIYGKPFGGASAAIAVDEKELAGLLHSHPGAVLDLEMPEGGAKPVLITEVQRDAISGRVLHVDFHQIDLNEKIRVAVRLEPVGDSPAEKAGGIVQLVQHEIEVECLPKDLPEAIPVPLDRLGLGDRLTAGDLALPAGVSLACDADTVVAAVLMPVKEQGEDAPDAEGGAGEESREAEEAAPAGKE